MCIVCSGLRIRLGGAFAGDFADVFSLFSARRYDLFHISEQSEAKFPHSQPEKDAHGEDDARYAVEPGVGERRYVGCGEDDGEAVELVKHTEVAAVGQAVDDALHLLIDLLDGMVGHRREEVVDIVGRAPELLGGVVAAAAFGESPEALKQVTDMIDAKLYGLVPLE